MESVDRSYIDYLVTWRYETCIKSHYIFKETIINKTPEAEAYNKIKSFKHDVERSTIELTHGIVDLQRQQCNIELCISSNSEDRQALRNTITAINGIKLSFDNLVGKRDLKKNLVKNIKDYAL